jgi:tetratricopeptide (TPR) repeat protein
MGGFMEKRSFLLITMVVLVIGLASTAFASESKVIVTKEPAYIYFLIGKYYFNNNDFENALKYFQKSIELSPDFAEAHHNLGVTYYKLNNKDDAVVELEKAIGIKSDYEKAYYSLALIYYGDRDYDDAIINLLSVVEINPENINANFDLGVSYVGRFRQKESTGTITSADLEDLKEALGYYRNVIGLNPEFPYAKSNAEIVEDVIEDYEN